MPYHSSEVCSAGLDFQSIFPQTDDKIASASLCPDYLKHALLTVCMGEDWSLRRMRRTLLSDMRKAWACLRADHLGLRLMDTSIRAMLSGVRTEDGQPGGFFTRDRAFFTPLPYPSTDCIWRWGLPVDSVHGEIRAESL